MAKSAEKYHVIPAALAVNAMRDSGYRNAAYAIAELVDNAIQAEATDIKIVCSEVETLPLCQDSCSDLLQARSKNC